MPGLCRELSGAIKSNTGVSAQPSGLSGHEDASINRAIENESLKRALEDCSLLSGKKQHFPHGRSKLVIEMVEEKLDSNLSLILRRD